MNTAHDIRGTTFSTPSDREVVMTRVVDAPRELVFEAWTNPEHLPHWFGRHGDTLPVCEVDLREGGNWRFVIRDPDGGNMGMSGVYREVSPPERVVTTEAFDDYPGETVNTVTFTEEDGMTRITVTVLYESKEMMDAVLATGMENGAAQVYERFADYVLTLDR